MFVGGVDGRHVVAGGRGASSSSAAFNLIKIRSIFRGPNNPAGAFIELQMYGDGQTQLSGHNLNLWTFDMSGGTGITLNVDVPNGQNQRMILIRDAASGLPADYKANIGSFLDSNAGGGLACWETVDCVAWGTFSNTSPPSPVGTPIVGGLSGSMVSVRRIDRGCPTALDEADDTNDSNSDFGFAVGYPVRDNSVTPTETLCPVPAPASGGTIPTARKKCKKHKKNTGAYSAKGKKCKKKKKHHAVGEQ